MDTEDPKIRVLELLRSDTEGKTMINSVILNEFNSLIRATFLGTGDLAIKYQDCAEASEIAGILWDALDQANAKITELITEEIAKAEEKHNG